MTGRLVIILKGNGKMIGQMVGKRYQILTQLGGGGFSRTFIAQDLQRPGTPQCVVKHLKPLSNDPYTLQEAQRLFYLEAATLETLGNHDQIPRLLAHFAENQEFYLVQELISGHDLSQELPPIKKPLTETEVIKLLTEILEVLSFVHQQNVIHRDIKPANIRRRASDNKLVLIDFGAVKQITQQTTNMQGQTSVTIAIGTPGYMPSEQANRSPQFCSDIYAVGIIGIQALTGIDIPNFGINALPINPSTREIDWRKQVKVSHKFANILDKMVRYDFRQRYQSADEALQAIQRLYPRNRSWKNWIKMGILAIFTLLGVVVWQIITSQETFLDYHNSNAKIKIKYPQSWERQDIQNIITQELVTFISPKQNENDKFQERLTVIIENYVGTLDESRESFTKEIKNIVPQANVLSASEATLANKKANQLVFTMNNGEIKLKNLQIWTLKDEKAYVITYTAAVDDYDKFLPIAEEIIESFKIEE